MGVYNLPRYNMATKENRVSHSQDDDMLVLWKWLHYKDVDFTNHGDLREHPEVPHEHTREWDGVNNPDRNQGAHIEKYIKLQASQ